MLDHQSERFFPLACLVTYTRISGPDESILMTLLFSFFQLPQEKHSLSLPASLPSSKADYIQDAGHQYLYTIFSRMCSNSECLRLPEICE